VTQPDLPTNRSMPTNTVIPVLAYADVRAAVDWLCRSFGFVERLRIGRHRSQLSYGEGSVVVTEGSLAEACDTLPKLGLSHSVMVRVSDINSHYDQAKSSGVLIVNPPTDYPYGERQYSAEDLGGHLWTFSQTIEDVNPEAWGGILVDETG
jgi:uncharacterized glyoxalase superfamily protein PhnB